MKRRDFITAASVAGLAAAAQSVKTSFTLADDDSERYYVLLEIFYAENKEKRAALVSKFDETLIPLRKELGFEKIGVFTINDDLMANERGYDAERYGNAVFVVQQTSSDDLLLNYQERSAKLPPKFNLENDLDYIDEEIIALKSFVSQPKIDVPNTNPERVLQLRTYNSPNYERNARKEKMFEDGELALFRRCGMAPVFFGSALFGAMSPNVTYMLSFENDQARREGWGKFVGSDEWKKMSKEPQYDRTATRIRNLFLKPSPKSEI